LTGRYSLVLWDFKRKDNMNNKEKQYQTALDATFTKEGYLRSNLNPKDIAARVYTAAEIAIGDGGFRAKEIVENFAQLMEMDSTRYAKQQKFYG
jgi:hypothetical protein